MKLKTIKESIKINASKEKVWEVVINDKYINIWYGEFSEGSHAQTDWKVGSKAIFVDNSTNGMVAKIIANEPGKILSMEFQGIVINGQENYETEEALFVKGGMETYHFSEINGITEMSIESDMADLYFDFMSEAWKNALKKVKELAESL